MKIANRSNFIPRLVLALAITGTSIGWIPQEKGKRKVRMADAAPELSRPVTTQVA
ncbi:hypothetical protein [Luteolibacter marinus]|uniref:hypothetical protein n=1 Tax=Luteolibacter marinus TaxID=2776705 RepID=UPI0018673290|nr:hypothetical protein [Luteolibacter marinus]